MYTRIFNKFSRTFVVITFALFSMGMFATSAQATINQFTLAVPNGGENWSGTQNIIWTQTGGILGDTISILLSTDSGGSYNTLITPSVDVTSLSYSWDTNNTAVGPLADGNTYKIKIMDGTTGLDFSSADFTVDNTAPTTAYSILPTLPDGANGWYTTQPTVTLTCADATSGCDTTSYSVDNGTSWQTYSVPFVVLEGTNNIKWYSIDLARNVEVTNGPNEVKVDTVAPATPVITSIAGDELINALEQTAVHVVGTAEASSTVSVTLSDSSNSVIQTGTATSGAYDIVLDITSLAEGTITPAVNATDIAGNTSSDATTPTATKDTIAPVTSGAPDLTSATDTGDSNSDDVTSNNMPDYYIGSCTTGNTITLYENTTEIGTGVCSGSSDVTISATTQTPDGTHDMTFTETDPAGNESAKSTALPVITDTVAPVAPAVTGVADDTGFSNTDGITNDNTLIFNGTASADTTNIEMTVAGLSTGSASVTTPASSSTWSFDNTGNILADDTYTVTAKTSDLAGNQGVASADFTLIVDTSAPIAPISSYTFDGIAADAFFNPGTITLDMTASEPVTWVSVQFQKVGDPSVYKRYNIDSSYDGTTSATQDWDGILSVGTQADVEYEVKVHVRDLAGNNTTLVLTPHAVTVDTTNPSIAINTPANDEVIHNTSGNVDFIFNATDTNLDTCAYKVSTGTYTNLPDCTSPQTLTLADGRQTVTLKATDKAGNIDEDSVNFVVDTDGILTVDDTPSNNPDFTTIQNAIDASVAGITKITVADGTYSENITVDKALAVIGANSGIDPNTGTRAGEAIISAPASGNIVTISSDGVTINGFTIENGGISSGVGIYSSDQSNLTIENNIITAIGNTSNDIVGRGIEVISSSLDVDNVSIANNKINDITSGLRTGSNSTSASAISIGWSTGAKDITNLSIQNNVISDIDADTNPWGTTKGQGAYGILINHGASGAGQVINAQITSNTINNLEGLWAHGVGLEGDTPGTTVTGNTISNLTDHKGGTDAVAIFAEDNPSISSITIHQNKMSNSAFGVALHPTLAGTSAGVLDATENWWGNATGPYNVNSNPGGLGVGVWPSVDDGQASYVDFNPFYNSNTLTNLVSINPIASFVISFNPNPQLVNQNSILTVIGKDAGGYTVINDTTTQVSLTGDNGSSFGSTLITMEADGDTATTITNSTIGIVNVTALKVGGSVTGTGQVTFTAGTATLTVTGIGAVKTYAIDDDTYTNGWSWVFHITVPTSETQFKMKFSDFVNGANTIPATGNIRFYSAQASLNSASTSATTITSANTYSSAITLDSDLEPSTPGRQIDVIVEMKVPTGTLGGSYSASYGVQSL